MLFYDQNAIKATNTNTKWPITMFRRLHKSLNRVRNEVLLKIVEKKKNCSYNDIQVILYWEHTVFSNRQQAQ